MLVVRCKVCNREITAHETQTKCCGCSNMTTVTGESVTAVDLSKVVMLQQTKKELNSWVCDCCICKHRRFLGQDEPMVHCPECTN